MELVYLWVDKYKSIGGKGFNFSSNEKFAFTPKIKDKKKYGGILKKTEEISSDLDSFFGENISMSAIVGENGTGKSSLMEVLEKCFFFINGKPLDFNIILLFKSSDKYNLITNFSALNSIYIKDFDLEFKFAHFRDIGLFSYYSEMPYQCKQLNMDEYSRTANPCFVRGKYLPPAMTFDNNWDEYKTVTFDKRYIGNFIYYANQKELIGLLGSEVFSPTKIALYSNDFFEEVPDNVNSIRKKLYIDSDVLEKIKPDSIAEVYERFMLNIIASTFMEQLEGYDNTNIVNLPSITYGETEQNIEKMESFLCLNHVENKLGYVFKYRFDELNQIPTNKEIELNKFEKKAKNLLFDKYFDFFRIEYIDNVERKYSGLSHGEKTLFSIMLNILMKVGFSNKKEFILFLDEPDLSLHPMWQSMFISRLLNLLNSLITEQHADTIQVLFTTHSPFLLSDLPKENIVFLRRNENGTFQDNEGLTNKKETFGANIHTLLSDSFFMKNGLMGEFAKNKIQDVINFLNDSQPTSVNTPAKAISIIKMIGEPFLKKQLEEMYSRKYPKDTYIVNKVLELKEEIKRLENDKNI